jgi:hypothetical protein
VITRLIVEKLLLTPTEQLKGLGDQDTIAAYSEALTRLFGLTQSAESEQEPDTSDPPVTSSGRSSASPGRPEREGRVEPFRPKSRPSSGSGR